ncbi:serine hydrolase domain-containing protein [Duganella levis]|uniref:Serine hydrolase n=1 Tax=Duganella levis TaxID=2692169 RepID=A0ABW9VTC4_9BURK|nr:serine hydrolase domain-containing protein [Duganella levis]MYN24879.1 serine hydrolase [Duganella levis]
MKRLVAVICAAFSVHAGAADVSGDVTAFLKQTMQEQRIPALQVAVIRHNKIVKLDAYGTANVENAVPATRDSIFSINSCTKAFTGVAIMQLVEAGKLGIDDPISRYLDDLPDAWRAITVKQVLTHVSGLPNIIDSKENPIGDGSDASAWATVKTLPLEFPAGERFKYNQTGYVIIGKIIDKLSGQPFARFIEERQFNVVGMPHTRFGDSSDVIPHSAGGYSYLRNDNGEWKTGDRLSAIYVSFPGYFRTAAGILSNAEDIAHWLIALQSGKLLKNKSSLDVLWSTVVLNDGKTGGMNAMLNGSALGWPVTTRAEHPAAGPIGGMRSTFFVYPKDDMSVVLLTNLQGANPENFADEVAAYYIPEMHASNGFGLPPQIKTLRTALLRHGFNHAASVYADLKRANAAFNPSEEEINDWAYLLFAQKQPKQSIAVLTLNTELHPASWNAFDSLGEIFQKAGDTTKAIENYRRSLKLNPDNTNATVHLKEMGAA